jgi:FkbM family methyltransferase
MAANGRRSVTGGSEIACAPVPTTPPAAAVRRLAARATVRGLRRLGYVVDGAGTGTILLRREDATDWIAEEQTIMGALARTQLGVLLRMYGVNCALDVGAHKGQSARALRAAGHRGRIVSFEPVQRPFEVLARRAADDPEWLVRQVAAGREDGEQEMQVVPGTLSSMLPATRFGAGRYERLREPEAQTIQVRRLDGLLDEVLAGVEAPRIFLKLDTQGFDLEAFAGLGDRVRDVVALQSEVALMSIYEGAPRMPDAITTYEQAGFEVAALYPVSRQSRTGRVLEYDCVMVRAAALRGAPAA